MFMSETLLFSKDLQAKKRADERTRTADLEAHYELKMRRCRGLPRVANPAFLSRFLFSGLLRVAQHCVPGGVRVVSGVHAFGSAGSLVNYISD